MIAERKRTVLIADDNPALRKQLCEVLTFSEFEVCAEAENGREAIEKAKECSPGLIILDLAMPVMSGIEAATELRKLAPGTPIILFTLYADAYPEKELQLRGITAVVSKTDPIESLLEKAESLLQV